MGSSAAASQVCSKNPASAGGMAGRVATGEFVSREQYKTADGKSASIYRTHVWRAWPGLKNLLTLICCSTCTFVLGPSLFVGMLWVCPQQLSIAVGALYGLHVLFGNAMHKGNLESYRWKSFDFHLAVMEYFRYQLLIEDDLVLKPERKYIVGTHPHGVYALGQLPFMFTSRHNPLFQLFPFLANTVHMTGASVIYYIPLVREMFLFCGFVVVSKPTLVHWLHRKHSVGIVVGGEAECLVAANNDDSLVLRGRKGFVRLALSHGADLLPTYCFHNTDVFSINTTLLHSLRSWLKKNLKISIPVMYGWRGTPFPHPVTLSLAIGAPIAVPTPRDPADRGSLDAATEWVLGGDPPAAVVDEYYEKYVTALAALFDAHKHAAGYSAERKLCLLDAPEHAQKKANAQKKASTAPAPPTHATKRD